MSNIKIKIKTQDDIKKKDTNAISKQKFKEHLITTKEKINGIYIDEENNTGTDYANRKIQNNINIATKKGIKIINQNRKKSLQETKNNYIKLKEQVGYIKSKVRNNNENLSSIAHNNQVNRLLTPNKHFTKRGIKTTENITNKTKNSVIKIKRTTRDILSTLKKAISGTKAFIYFLIAGGWILVLIVLVISVIGGTVSSIFKGQNNEDYDYSKIPNNEIILVAKSQIGNEGGEKFWRWYGFDKHVEWCACFVSWCANECNYIEKGIVPKFSYCDDAIKWFDDKEEWHSRNDGYLPISGDLIFFDWKDDNGNQDGISDHVGIVTKMDISNEKIYTIEGNTSNQCAERVYSFNDTQILGYGSPKYKYLN